MKSDIERKCAVLLRELRKEKGLTLEEFEILSKGAVKAVVLGSYERGTRAISLARLEQLAEIYEVPIEYFFDRKVLEKSEPARLVFDLRRIRVIENLDETLEPIKRYIGEIARLRSDWFGEVLSVRSTDGDNISLITGMPRGEMKELLKLSGFLFERNN